MVDYSTLKNYNIMNKQKLNYLAPEAETLVIRFEENILSYKVNSVNHTEYLGIEEDGGELS